MYMLLHHQKRRNFTDGTFVHIGEDGYPYADNEMLIVADGLGGRGGYPHTKINPAILNPEIFYNSFIAPVVGIADPNYAMFVTNSFHELFELGPKYFSGTATMRTSGYFASRLVTAIVLHALKFNPDFRRDVIFDNIRRMEGEQQKQYIDKVRNRLAAIIQVQLTEIAKRMGLELESKTKGSYLLPTTLTVVLINETTEGLDVLYLWAGDSRGYLWNTEGLKQITDDHERDETMTNLITLTKPFQLEARLFKTSKPAILFNATDGCYKCPCFASAFDLEYVFLQAIQSANSFDETSNNLDKRFTVIGTHDDSNTMALTPFGYESFDAIKAEVAQRLAYLQEHFIQELPGILERDYEDELNQIDEQMEGGIFAVKDSLIEIEPIVEFVKQRMVDEGYAPYIQELTSLKKKLEELDAAEENQKENIIKWVQYYWLRTPGLKQYTAAKNGFFRGDSYEKIAEMEAICSEEKQRYVATYTKILEDLNDSISAVVGMRDSILNLEAPHDKDMRWKLAQSLKASHDLLDKIEDGIVKGKIERAFSRYYRGNSEINELNRRYIKQENERVMALATEIIKGDFIVDGLAMPQECRIAIDSYIKTLQDIAEARKETCAEINGLKDKHLMSYWSARVCHLIMTIRREHSELIPEEIKCRIADNIGDLQAKHDELERCLQVRNQLYDIYNKEYYRYLEESAL